MESRTANQGERLLVRRNPPDSAHNDLRTVGNPPLHELPVRYPIESPKSRQDVLASTSWLAHRVSACPSTPHGCFL